MSWLRWLFWQIWNPMFAIVLGLMMIMIGMAIGFKVWIMYAMQSDLTAAAWQRFLAVKDLELYASGFLVVVGFLPLIVGFKYAGDDC